MESLVVLDDILQAFDAGLVNAFPILELAASFLAQAFLIIMIVFSGVAYAFGNTSAGVEMMVKKILLLSGVAFLLQAGNWSEFADIIIQSLASLGLDAGGVATVRLNVDDLFSPSNVGNLGVNLSNQILLKLADTGTNIVGLPNNFGDFLLLFVAALVMGLAFIVIAIQVFVILIEFKIVTLAGLILIPFAILERTSSLAQNVLGYVIAAGLKMFVIGIIISFAFNIVGDLALQDDFTVAEGFGVIATALVFLMLAINVPGLAASVATGGPSLGLGAVGGTLATVGGIAAAGIASGRAAYSTARGITSAGGTAGAAIVKKGGGGGGGGGGGASLASRGGGGGGSVGGGSVGGSSASGGSRGGGSGASLASRGAAGGASGGGGSSGGSGSSAANFSGGEGSTGESPSGGGGGSTSSGGSGGSGGSDASLSGGGSGSADFNGGGGDSNASLSGGGGNFGGGGSGGGNAPSGGSNPSRGESGRAAAQQRGRNASRHFGNAGRNLGAATRSVTVAGAAASRGGGGGGSPSINLKNRK